MTQTYRLPPGIYKRSRKRSIIVTITTAVFVIAFLYLGNKDNEHYMTGAFPLTMAAIAVIITAMTVYKLRKQRRIMESYVLTLDEEGITREQLGAETIHIPFTGIISVAKFRGGLLIKGIEPRNIILAPSALVDYETFETKMQSIISFSKPEKKYLKTYGPLVLMLVMLVLLGIFSRVKEPSETLVTGAILLPLLIWSIFYARKSKHFSIITVIALVIIAAAVAIVLLEKITGVSILNQLFSAI